MTLLEVYLFLEKAIPDLDEAAQDAVRSAMDEVCYGLSEEDLARLDARISP